MDSKLCATDQAPENQWDLKIAPKPNEPAASDENCKSARGAHGGIQKKTEAISSLKKL